MKNTINKILIVLTVVACGSFFAPVAFAAGPTMLTMAPSNITGTSATLNGSWSSTAGSTDVRFEYGLTSVLGSFTSYTTQTNNAGSYSANISGLLPNTMYYFRTMGVDANGPGYGVIANFTTVNGGGSVCVINSFTANQTVVSPGVPTVLSWSTSNCSSASLSSIGTVVISGSQTVNPLSNTTYTLSVSGPVGTDSKSISIIVGSATPTSCVINYFSTNQTTVTNNNGAFLSWSTSNCSSASLSSVGSVPTSSAGYAVYPSGSTTYTLSASNGITNDSMSLSINVSNNNSCGVNCGNNGCNCYYNPQNQGSGYYQSYPQYSYYSALQPSYYQNSQPYYQNQYPTTYATTSALQYGQPQVATAPVGYFANPKPISAINQTNTNPVGNASVNGAADNGGSNLAAGAGFALASFFPSTIIGWLTVVFFILLLVIMARILFKDRFEKQNHSH